MAKKKSREADDKLPIELLRAVEIDEWLEVERLRPDDGALSRIAARFRPPLEWFDEEDVL